jgi:hypothetical protein
MGLHVQDYESVYCCETFELIGPYTMGEQPQFGHFAKDLPESQDLRGTGSRE